MDLRFNYRFLCGDLCIEVFDFVFESGLTTVD